MYERRITDFFTMQVGAGLTHRNYARTLIQKAINENDNGNLKFKNESDREIMYNLQSEQPFEFNLRSAKLGYMFSIQPRLYFESEAPEGFFLGASFDYMRYNFEIPSVTSSSNGSIQQTGPSVKEYENVKDFMIKFGSQQVFDKLTLEATSEVGLRNVSGATYIAGRDYNSSTIKTSLAPYTQSRLNFNFGFKVGYHF